MKAAIYARVSTKEQSVESQLLPVRDYCLRNNFSVHTEYKDEGVSGAKDSRPELDRMLRDMRKGEFEAVMVYKLDRLGRSLSHLLVLLSEFRNRKIRLISVSDNLDTVNDNPMSRAFWQLLGVFAEFERELIKERVQAGLERAKKEGKVLGRPKGVKDSRKRSVSGYVLRYAGKTKAQRRLGLRGGN
jgi:putative DNA-invertase from lambdoid prophage Rac